MKTTKKIENMKNLTLAKTLINNTTSIQKLKSILHKYIDINSEINDEEWNIIKANKVILETHNYNTDDLQMTIDATNTLIEKLLLTPNKTIV